SHRPRRGGGSHLRQCEWRSGARRPMASGMARPRKSAEPEIFRIAGPGASPRAAGSRLIGVLMRSYDIPELRRLDLEHHLPAQANYGEIQALGGSRIITRAEGSTIYDGEGAAILDGMAGLWCVNVGYGRDELVAAATEQMKELPFYNTF